MELHGTLSSLPVSLTPLWNRDAAASALKQLSESFGKKLKAMQYI